MSSLPDPVDRFARGNPPRGHVGRVLARTGPGTPHTAGPPPRVVPVRWLLPVAATLLIAVGAYVQSDRSSRHVPLAPPPPDATWSGKGVDVPVLPPRAYWEMSAFDEFARLRPGGRGAGDRRTPPAPMVRRASSVAWTNDADDGPALDAPTPVEVETIAVDMLRVAPLDMAPSVALEPITVEPIPIRPLAEEAP